MTPCTLGDNQRHVGLMWWLTGFSNRGGQWVHLQTGLRGKQRASQLMQTCLSRGLCPNVFPPSEWKCVKGSFLFASRGPRPWVWHTFFFFQTVKESAWASSLSNCIKLRPPSPFNSKAKQLVAFIFNPGDITFHHIPLGPPNPLWSISLVLMRLLLREVRRCCNIQSWNYHLVAASHHIICPVVH